MNIVFDLEDSITREILDFADDDECSFEEAILYLLKKGLEKSKTVSLDSDAVNDLIEGLISQALKTPHDKPFLLTALYKLLRDKPVKDWSGLHPTTRKMIGRRFRQAIAEHETEADDGDPIIEFIEKTAQNSALYRITEKF